MHKTCSSLGNLHVTAIITDGSYAKCIERRKERGGSPQLGISKEFFGDKRPLESGVALTLNGGRVGVGFTQKGGDGTRTI